MDKSSILIVDDVAKNIQLVAKFLKNEGYNLYFARNGEEALKQVEIIPFDLILLDIMMPGMDGFEVCKVIKDDQKTKDIPIIFLTARTDDEAIAKGFGLGGVDYITKPFNSSELIARVKTHLQLRKREMELQDLNSTKDTLLSIISHDLKTPFYNIIGLGEILLTNYDEYADEMIKEMLKNIIDSATLSHNLLENLLSWTRVQSGKMKFEPQSVELRKVIEEIFKLAKAQADNKEVTCTVLIDEQIKVYADRNMLNTIFRNLISNALKYTSTGGSVTAKAIEKDRVVKISILDTGVGIHETKLKTMFKPVDTISTPGTDGEPGTGFGLILTNEFVMQNKGKIQVKSKEGEGTEFIVELPSGRSK